MKEKRPYAEMLPIAERVLEQLRPHTHRIQIAGSLRRKRDLIGDVEIVLIPKPYQTGLFEDGLASVVNQWEKVKGEMIYGEVKYTQRILPEGVKLDIFFATPETWGLVLAVRTGSAEYSHKVLAQGWSARGYKCVENYLVQNGKRYETREEIDLFNRLNIPYVEPEFRNL